MLKTTYLQLEDKFHHQLQLAGGAGVARSAARGLDHPEIAGAGDKAWIP